MGEKYCGSGKDKGSQRFKCREHGRTFTEYTGTWLDGLCKKSMVVDHIGLMIEGKSLDRISRVSHIDKKKAFDWRCQILFSLNQDSGDMMKGIVESDETFFEESEKGNRHMKRKGS